MTPFDRIGLVLGDCIEASEQVLPSEAVVGHRLLAHRDRRLADAFYEISTELRIDSELKTFLGLVMSAAAPWSMTLETVQAATQIEALHLNRQIAEAANLLRGMLHRREEMRFQAGWPQNTLYWPADVLGKVFDETGKNNGVADGLKALQAAFDHTQWPSMSDACKVIADNAAEARTPQDQPIESVDDLPARERARRFAHSLLNAMYIGNGHVNLLPEDFELTDATLAALTNVALDLTPDQLVMASDMRGLRPWIYPWEEEP